MSSGQFTIWTGGEAFDPEVGRRVAAIEPLPDPEPLPRAALVTHWWGTARFEMAVHACSIRTTPWGDGTMTWLHYKGVPLTDGVPQGQVGSMTYLVPAECITGVLPGPTFRLTSASPRGLAGLFPPSRPAPPHALPLDEIESALAGLADVPDGAAGFSVRYPLFVLRHADGSNVCFNPGGGPLAGVRDVGVPVFTTEDGADSFLRELELHPTERFNSYAGVEVEEIDRFAEFRRFLRSIRDRGTFVLFDPAIGNDSVYVDHSFTAAVLLERHLPQIAWGFSYPVYVLRIDGPTLTLATTEAHRAEDGATFTVLPVFTDDDLADRALAHVPKSASVLALPDREAFEKILEEMPAGSLVAFDHEQTPNRKGRVVMPREALLENLENLEL